MERKHSTFTKLLSLVLVFAMLVEFLPANVFAAPEDEAFAPVEQQEELLDESAVADVYAEPETDIEQETDASVVGEVTDLREESIKHFRMDDGSFIAVDYGMPVHFTTDDGESWEPIDNTLTLEKTDADEFSKKLSKKSKAAIQEYAANNGDKKTSFASDLQNGFLFSTEDGDHKISMSLFNPVINKIDIAKEKVVNDLSDAVAMDPADTIPTEETEEKTDWSSEAETDAEAEKEIEANAEEKAESEAELNAADEAAEEAEEEADVDAISALEAQKDPEELEVSEAPEPVDSKKELKAMDQLKSLEKEEFFEKPAAEESESLDIDSAKAFNAIAKAEISYPEDQKALAKRAFKGIVSDNYDDSQLTLTEQITPSKLSADVLYRDVFEGVDLSYELNGYNIKEDIVVKTRLDSYVFTFCIDVGDLTPVMEEDGSIQLEDFEQQPVYIIPAPYMYDAASAESDAVFYELSETEDGVWALTVTADAEWINAEERVFPVEIDPSVFHYGNSSNNRIYTSYVNSGSTTSSYNKKNFIRCGDIQTTQYGSGHSIGLIYVNSLPAIPDGSVVTDAQLGLYQVMYGYAEPGYYNYAYLYTSTFNSGSTPGGIEQYLNGLTWSGFHSDITYGNGTSIATRTAIDYNKCQYNTLGRHYFKITDTVRKWYENSTGISRLLVLDSEDNSGLNTTATFSGYYHDEISHRPHLIVAYRDTIGTGGLYDYHTHNIGRAGTSNLNNFTLGLTLNVPIMSAPSEALPFAFSLYYNSAMNDRTFTSGNRYTKNYTTSSTGYGWKTSVQQSIVPLKLDGENGSQTKHLIYTDEDGTEHYFKIKDGSSTVYEDEDGLNLKITASSSADNPTYYTMEDKEKNKWTFDYGYLTQYEDNHGNALYFVYNGVDYSSGSTNWKPNTTAGPFRVTSVWRKNSTQTSAEKLLTLIYSNNKLYSVTDAANRKTTFAFSSNGDLIRINYPDYNSSTAPNCYASYTYTSQSSGGKTYHQLTKVRDNEAQYEIRYTYQYGTYFRVSEITEYAGAVGSEVAGATMRGYKAGPVYTRFRYGGSDNTFSSDAGDDIVVHYHFDDWGRTINSATLNQDESEVLGVSAGTFTKNEGTSKKNNRMTSAASAGLQSNNLLSNSGFELSIPEVSGWLKSGNGTAWTTTGSTSYSQETLSPRTGAKMLQLYLASTSQVKETCYQNVYLMAGKTYVFSAYVNTAGAESMGTGGAYISFRNSSGADISGTVGRTLNYKTSKAVESGWERLETVFTPNQNGQYQVAINITHMSKVAYVDDVQLEVMPGTGGITNEAAASKVNLLQIGSFDLPGANGTWSTEAARAWWNFNYSDTVSYVTDADKVRSGAALQLNNRPDWKCHASQTVSVKMPSASTFLISAWGKTPVCSISDGSDMLYNNETYKPFFGLIVKIAYSNTTELEYHYVAFNGSISDWQYVTGTIVPKREDTTVTSITVTVAGDLMANPAYVDNVTLVAEPVQTYSYDEKGNLLASTNAQGQISTHYDDNERLNEYKDMRGVKYTLDYEGTKRVPKTVTSDGLETGCSYNNNGEVTQTKIKPTNGSMFLQSSEVYAGAGNFKTSTTDTNDLQVTRTYDSLRGVLTQTTLPAMNKTTNYTYYANNDRPKSMYQSGVANVTNYYDGNGRVQYIARKTFSGTESNQVTTWQTYGDTYDEWGQKTQLVVSRKTDSNWTAPTSSRTLMSYDYNLSGTLAKKNYPNGDYIDYTYDLFDRTSSEVYTNQNGTSSTNSYIYNPNGDLAKKYSSTGEVYNFEYDSLGRMIRSREDNGTNTVQRTEHQYDTANRLKKQKWAIGNDSFEESYEYRSGDGALSTFTAATGNKVSIAYDALKRPSTVTTKNAAGTTTLFYTARNYKAGSAANQTTNRVSGFAYRKNGGSILNYNTYAYDEVGNITQINQVLDSGTRPLAKYTYDKQNQLTKEIRYSYSGDSLSGTSTTVNYSYDTAGNLLGSNAGSSSQVTYSYSDSNWADLLTSVDVDGTTRTISYSGSNPTNWYNGSTYSNLTWVQGRQLKSLKKGNSNISYTYDMDGIRSSKNVGGDIHSYVTQNGKVIRDSLSSPDACYTLDFIYDNAGKPFAMIYTNSGGTKTTYYYVLNALGDVVSLINSSGTVYASYTYDAWGKLLTSSGTMASKNPLRYRGYYYDNETGWYYLQSRYYDPIIKRFINADAFASTGQGFLGYNMFAYCNNQPIIYRDSSGTIIELSDNSMEEEYVRAVDYIKNSEVGAALIEKLEASSEVFTVVFVDDDNMRFEPNTGKIYFDPYSGLVMGDKTSVQSAALGLAHEMGHAAQFLDGELYGDNLTIELIENANLQKYETPIAKQLGEPIRSNYSDCAGCQRMNNSTHFKTTYLRPWWHYLAPWNWGKPSKVITEHNKNKKSKKRR